MNYYNYFTEIEETFVRRRGKSLFLSPLDWALIEAWQDQGIPLHIVIRSIESVFDVFDQQPPGTRSIKSLLYCKEEVEAQYEEWMRSRAGSSGEGDADGQGVPLEAIRLHIESAIGQLSTNANERLRESVERAVARLHEVANDLTNNMEMVDQTLGDIENILSRALLSDWDPEHLKILKKEVAGHLRAYKAEMDKASYQNTFDLMLIKRLREEAQIPRLGLFYL